VRESAILDFLHTELAPSPERYRATARITIACVIAVAVIMTFQLPEGHWIIITIFVVSQPNAGASVSKALQRVAGTLVGAAAGILLTIAFPQEPSIRVPLFGLLCGLGLFFSRTTTAPYVGLLSAMTLILVFGGVVTNPAQQVELGLWRLLIIALGIIIGTSTQLFLWPLDPETALLDELAQTLADTAVVLRTLVGGSPQLRPAEPVPARLTQQALTGLARQLDLLAHAEARYPRLRKRRSEQLACITACNRLATASTNLQILMASPAVRPSSPDGAQHLRTNVEGLVRMCVVLGDAIASRRPPGSSTLPPGLTTEWPTEDAGAAPTILRPTLIEIGQALAQLPPALAFLDLSAAAAALPSDLRSPLDNPDSDRFLTARFSLTNSDDLRFAAKGALAVVVCYVLINAFNWEEGLTAVVSGAIVAQGSFGATLQKALLRLVGGLLGGVAAFLVILYLMPNITSLPALLIVSAIGMGIAGYVNAGSARISYVGLQMGMAFAVALLDTSGPTVNLLPPLDRVLGILLGNVTTACVFSLVWPVFASEQMVRSLATALRHMVPLSRLGIHDQTAALVVRPARGWRLQVFQDLATTLQLCSESAFEAPGTGQPQRTAVLALLDEAQSIFLLVLAVVRHRLNVHFLDAPPELVQPVRAVALAIGDQLEAVADTLSGDDRIPTPALDRVLSRAAAAMAGAPVAATATQREAVARLADQLEYYRQLVPRLGELRQRSRWLRALTLGNTAAHVDALGVASPPGR
jgi:multidrug resistance protein MdtO